MIDTRQPGNTLSEYTIILSLVGVAAVGALVLFGGSVSDLIRGANGGVGGPQATNLSSMQFARDAIEAETSASARVGQDSFDPTATIYGKVVNQTNSNNTAVNGNTPLGVTQTSSIADRLRKLAQEATDPNLAAWLNARANDAFFLASAEASVMHGKNKLESSSPLVKMSAIGSTVDQVTTKKKGKGLLGAIGDFLFGKKKKTTTTSYTLGDAVVDTRSYKTTLETELGRAPAEFKGIPEFEEASRLIGSATQGAAGFISGHFDDSGRFIQDSVKLSELPTNKKSLSQLPHLQIPNLESVANEAIAQAGLDEPEPDVEPVYNTARGATVKRAMARDLTTSKHRLVEEVE